MLFDTTADILSGASRTFAVAHCGELAPCALTPRERRDYDGLPHETRRRDWLAGRCAAKRAIGARWDVPAEQIEVVSTPGAAPQPRIQDRTGSWTPLPDRLTIAHRDGIALAVAFSSRLTIGVDLEREDELSPRELRYFLSSEERSRHDAVDATLVWALKEAAWKALGFAPNAPLSSVQLLFRVNTSQLVAVSYGTRLRPARAGVARLQAARPLIAALVEIAPEAS